MFLPAILVRDMGAWVLAVFAVPNIVGAGLVGWTDLADRLRRRHSGLVRAFSVLTIAFQAFFASVLISRLGPISGAGVMAGFVCVWGVMTLGRSPIRPTQVVFGVSALAGLVLLWTLGGQLATSVSAETSDVVGGGEGVAAGSAGVIALLALAPVVAFGFLLCPPMDATFQHVRLQTRDRGGDCGGERGGRRTRVAFTLGFGVFFPLLIALTPVYGPVARGLMLEQGYIAPGVAALAALVVHLVVQLGATGGLHARVQMRSDSSMREWVFAALAIGVASCVIARLLPAMFGLSGVELIYRVYMTAYGLMFPAYVWIVLWGNEGKKRDGVMGGWFVGLSAAALRVWVVGCVAASPFYFVGFMLRDEVWLVPGLAIVLACGPISRVLSARTKTDPNANS